MRERYKPSAIVAGLLFLVSAIGGLIGSGVLSDHGGWTGAVVWMLVGVIMAVAGYIWSRQYPLGRVVPDVLLSVTVGCVLAVGLVPLFSEMTATGKWHWGPVNPFDGGAGLFFAKIWVFYGCGLVGAAFGWMLAVALGQDHRTKALKQFTKTVTARPHRPVRR